MSTSTHVQHRCTGGAFCHTPPSRWGRNEYKSSDKLSIMTHLDWFATNPKDQSGGRSTNPGTFRTRTGRPFRPEERRRCLYCSLFGERRCTFFGCRIKLFDNVVVWCRCLLSPLFDVLSSLLIITISWSSQAIDHEQPATQSFGEVTTTTT
jgi:hypothetical protein